MYQRTLKKICLVLLEKVSVRNKYKSNDEREYLYAYTETFAIFSMIFLEGKSTEGMLYRFLEFISIYYPISKVIKIAKNLEDEGSISTSEFKKVELLIKYRCKTAKRNFGKFAKHNKCVSSIINYSKSVFAQIGERVLKGKAKRSVEKVLSFQNY